MLRLDWFEATLECDVVSVIALAMVVGQSVDGTDPTMKVGKGRNGYKRSHVIESEHFTITILDLHASGWPHIVGTGASANAARQIARSIASDGRVSRIDIASDTLEGWAAAENRVALWALEHPKTSVTHFGDFYQQQRGRTLYVGAPASERRVRVYEKGVQLGEDRNWVRVELQYRPPNRAAKAWAFNASLTDIANSHRAFVALRGSADEYTPPGYVRPVRQPIIALAQQYGNVLREEVPEAWRIIVDYLKRDWRPRT